jgi:hypothetical protein
VKGALQFYQLQQKLFGQEREISVNKESFQIDKIERVGNLELWRVHYSFTERTFGNNQWMVLGLFVLAALYSVAIIIVKPRLEYAVLSFIVCAAVGINLVGLVGVWLGYVPFYLF